MTALSRGVQTLGGAVLKKALGQFYDSVEKLGFTAGGEFIAAVQEGNKIPGAKILLGDQDVDVTLQRLASALGEYQSPDSLLGLVEKLDVAEQKLGIEVSDQMDKAALSSLVEKLKTRDALGKIIDIVKREAPGIYNAMIGDRDSYMARSIATADSKLLVGVVGIAHLAGIEANLQRAGYKVAKRLC
jgi:pheromone shutdown protein TraB